MLVSGRVTDKKGNTLPGVAVLLKGTTVGTATDMEGNFKFLMSKEDNALLVFSFIGMKRLEIPVKFGEPMKVTLEEDATELDEVKVISTGYYNVDKRHLTSSVTSLKMDDIMMPGISGMCGVAPVLMKILPAVTVTGPSAVAISALCGPMNRARPVSTVILSWSASL